MRDLTIFLTPLPFPPDNMPEGEALDTKASQNRCDAQYLDQLKGYFDRGDTYVATETIKRNSSNLRGNYPRIAYPAPIPQRQIVSWTPNDWGGASMTLTYAPKDPRIVPPVLPEWVDAPASPSGPLTGGYKAPLDPVETLRPMLQAIMDHFGISV